MNTKRWVPISGYVIAICVLLRVAQGQPSPQTGQQTGVIQGTVARTGTGQALKRARVNLRRAGSNTGGFQQGMPGVLNTQAVTDDTGRFVFNGVAPGDYRISVDREGYIHQEYGQRTYKGLGMTVSLAAGQQLTNIDFQMVPTGSISGRILDEDGEPMANVQVLAETYTYQQGRRTLVPSGQAGQTNDLGEYRIYWLTPGEYYVSAVSRRAPIAAINPVISQQVQIARATVNTPSGDRIAVQQNNEAYAPAYFPGTVFPESATAVPVPAGSDVRGIDFAIHPTATVTVKGQVVVPISSTANSSLPPPSPTVQRGNVGANGAGGRQINVMLARMALPSSSAGMVSRGAMVQPDGGFAIANVIPGSYMLAAVAQQNGQEYSARMRVEVSDRGVDNLSLPLRAGVSVSGRVYIDGALPNGYKVSQMRVVLQSADDVGLGLPGGRGGNAQVADDGTFTLQNVSAMNYRVRVIGLPAGGYVMAGRIGNDDAVNQPFYLAGDQDLSLQLQIGFSTAQVTGTVVDEKGNPYAGALATLVPDEPARLRTDLYFSVPTDQYGHFIFSNVPAGGYKVFGWEDMSDGAYQDPEFIQRFEARGISIKMDSRSSVEQQVGIIRR